jgi:hypothetical protein
VSATAARAPTRAVAPHRSAPPVLPSALPRFELRVQHRAASDDLFEVWQLPAPATPHLKQPKRLAGLGGRNLALIEAWVLKTLGAQGIDPVGAVGVDAEVVRAFPVPEQLALQLGLTFRVLAPMRSRTHMRAVADGVASMGKEEAAYWLGMAMHRKHPRRVLMALRFLLIDPRLV